MKVVEAKIEAEDATLDEPAILEEDGPCPNCQEGKLEYGEVEGCSCHLNPPCGPCLDNPLICNECDFSEED